MKNTFKVYYMYKIFILYVLAKKKTTVVLVEYGFLVGVFIHKRKHIKNQDQNINNNAYASSPGSLFLVLVVLSSKTFITFSDFTQVQSCLKDLPVSPDIPVQHSRHQPFSSNTTIFTNTLFNKHFRS